MKFLKHLQGLSLGTRKIILWIIMVVVAAGFLFLFLSDTRRRFQSLESQNIFKKTKVPDFSREMENIKKIKLPDKIRNLENIKNAENLNNQKATYPIKH